MTLAIEMRGVRKRYGSVAALDGIDLSLREGRILGIIGANGAGKTTLLHALIGLVRIDGEVRMLGRDPRLERRRLMEDVSFVADVSVLPRWMRVAQALAYMEGVHPRFDRDRAVHLLSLTTVSRDRRIGELSKGMIAQLHLALALATDALALVLDEPTLGLDPLYRKHFYDTLLTDFADRPRTVVLATHQVEEVEHVITDVAIMRRGQIQLACAVDDIADRYVEVLARPEHVDAAEEMGPIHRRDALGRTVMLYDGVAHQRLAPLGELRTPPLAEVFAALASGGDAGEPRGGSR